MSPYDTAFYESQMKRSYQSAEKILPYIFELTAPKSITDIGCGVGGWLAQAKIAGIDDILGFDGDYVDRSLLKIPQECFIPANLSKPLNAGRKFDLAISLEVAEHIPEKNTKTFIENIISLSDVILFSAAIPGQGGVDHVNEQWPDYWIEKFSDKGFIFLDCIRHQFWNDDAITPCYRQNAFLFVKAGEESRLPSFRTDDFNTLNLPERIVHPEIFHNILADSIHHTYFSKAVKALPRLFFKAVSSRINSKLM